MKTIFSIFLLITTISCLGQKQLSPTRIKINKEVKGKDNIYIVTETNNDIKAINKKNKLWTNNSAFQEHDQNIVLKEISINNIKLLDKYVKKYFNPYFKKNNSQFKNYDWLWFYFYADIDGNIMELDIIYPKTVEIPIEVIEQFEKEALSGDINLLFDKELPIFKGSVWVGRDFIYGAQKVRDM